MEVGFIGLGNMGFPMACRLLQDNHDVVAFDTRSDRCPLSKTGECYYPDRRTRLTHKPAKSPATRDDD